MGKKKGYEVSEVESNQVVDVGTVIFTPQDYDAIINPKCHLAVEQSATRVESISGSVQSDLNGIKEGKDELEKTSRTELADKLDTKVKFEEVAVESCQEPLKKKPQGKWPITKIVKYLVIAVAVVSILVLISVLIPGRKKQKTTQRATPLIISIIAITDRNGTTIFKKEEVTDIARKPIRYFVPDVDEVPTNATLNESSEDFGSGDTSQTDTISSETYTPSSELTTQQEEFATTFNETGDSSSDPSTSSTILNLKEPNSTILVVEDQTPSTTPTELVPGLDEHSTVVSASTPTLVSLIDGLTTIDDEDKTTLNDGETTVDDRVITTMPIKETTLFHEGSGAMEDSDYSY